MPEQEPPGPPSTSGPRAGDAPDQGGALEPASSDPFGLRRLVDGAAAALRDLAAGTGSDAGGKEQAMDRLVEGILRTNMRLADAVLRPDGTADLADLQRRFLRDYLAALAQGGTALREAAQGAAPGEAFGGATVGEAMRRDIVCAGPDDSVQDTLRRMAEQRLSALPVCEDGRLVGVVTDHDLAGQAPEGGGDQGAVALRAVMRTDPPFVFEDDPLPLAMLGMADQHAPCLPVVNRERRVMGVLALDGGAPRQVGPGAAG